MDIGHTLPYLSLPALEKDPRIKHIKSERKSSSFLARLLGKKIKVLVGIYRHWLHPGHLSVYHTVTRARMCHLVREGLGLLCPHPSPVLS